MGVKVVEELCEKVVEVRRVCDECLCCSLRGYAMVDLLVFSTK